MKKRPKLLLISGAVIVSVGIIVCIVGSVMAGGEGNQLFAGELEGGYGYSYSFEGEDITKINIEATNANVNIIGNAKESKIELINFNENFYSFNISNRLITFKESANISSVLRFWENGFTFKGMRYILMPAKSSGDKIINIYLTEADYVKNFTVQITKGTISASDLSKETSYKFTLGDGAVKMNNIETKDNVLISAPSATTVCDMKLVNVRAATVKLGASHANLTAENLACSIGDFDITHGSAKISYMPIDEFFRVNVNANGKLTVNEVSFITKYSCEKLPASTADGGSEETTAAQNISALTVDGRELSVYLTGECFGEPEAEQ